MRLFYLTLFTLLPSLAQATVIQILHTNDLHSALETAGAPQPGDTEYGGWAQVKTTLDELAAGAKAKGIETIKLDAGDFSEGTIAYFPDQGVHVLKAFQDIGFDAAALGNHDWLMGARDMDLLYGRRPFPFPVLSANLKISSSLPNLKSQILPSTQIVRNGIKIGVFGLSTNEDLYAWIPEVNSRKNDLKIKGYFDQHLIDGVYNEPTVISGLANKMIRSLRADNDVVIALTHIGLSEDKTLAAGTRGLDLIVGGHSHTVLESSATVKDLDGRDIQIVQTGYNGRYVGKILLEVTGGKKKTVRVLSYELVPVYRDTAQDPVIAQDIQNANAAKAKLYGNRLDEVIGTSSVRLVSGDSGPTAFSKFVVDAMRDVAGTDIAFDIGPFHGNTPQAAGDITRRKLMEMYPRKFEADQNEGLYVYQARVPGFLITIALKFAMQFGMFISSSGLTYDLAMLDPTDFDKLQKKYTGNGSYAALTPYYPTNIRVNGEPLQSLRWYSAAGPESLVRGAFGITELLKLVVRDAYPTPHTIWDVMNAYLLKKGSIDKLKLEDHYNLANFSRRDRHHYAIHHNFDGFAEGEGFVVPWLNELASPGEVINNSLSEIMKQVTSRQINPVPTQSGATVQPSPSPSPTPNAAQP